MTKLSDRLKALERKLNAEAEGTLSPQERDEQLDRFAVVSVDTAAAGNIVPYGVWLNRCRCVHHVHDQIRAADDEGRYRALSALDNVEALLEHRAAHGGPPVSRAGVLAYLASLNDRDDFWPCLMLPLDQLRALHPDASPDVWARRGANYIVRGPTLPACAFCEPERAADTRLVARIAALSDDHLAALLKVGCDLALDHDAPPLAGQVGWLEGQAMPTIYQPVVAEALVWARGIEQQPARKG